MNSHIAITALKNGKQVPLNLPDDFSIDIDDQNPLFNDNEMFSYPCRMPMEGNRFLLGNIDDPLNIDRPVGLEHTKMRIVVDNQPFRSGTLVTAEDEEIDGALTMNISASDHSIDDLIGDLKCQDIPLKDKILIYWLHIQYFFRLISKKATRAIRGLYTIRISMVQEYRLRRSETASLNGVSSWIISSMSFPSLVAKISIATIDPASMKPPIIIW